MKRELKPNEIRVDGRIRKFAVGEALLDMGDGYEPVFVQQRGVMIMVFYPHRRSTELLISVRGHAVRCFICRNDLEGTKSARRPKLTRLVSQHVLGHARRIRRGKGKSLFHRQERLNEAR